MRLKAERQKNVMIKNPITEYLLIRQVDQARRISNGEQNFHKYTEDGRRLYIVTKCRYKIECSVMVSVHVLVLFNVKYKFL